MYMELADMDCGDHHGNHWTTSLDPIMLLLELAALVNKNK